MSKTNAQNDSPAGNAPPIQNGPNRGPGGRFAKGNSGGPGSGIARKVARFRNAMFSTVKPGDVKEIIAKLIEQAKAGESWAVKLALEYLCGPPRDVDLEERLAALEEGILKGKQ